MDITQQPATLRRISSSPGASQPTRFMPRRIRAEWAIALGRRNEIEPGGNVQKRNDISRINAMSPIPLIFIFLILTDLSIFLDIPVFRQILGFILLAFVPGMLLICILNPDKPSMTERFVLSVGLSISFIMFTGILINTLYPLFNYQTPLSLISLLFSFNVAILALAVVVHARGEFVNFVKKPDLRLDIHEKALFIIPVLFPALSILGMHLMNTTDNNFMLMVLLFLIPGYVIIISVWNRQIPEKSYPLIIFMMSISLVLLLGMRSNHIIGADAHTEYYIFQQTLSNEKWQILSKTTLDSCLSISILPAAYQSFLNVNSEYLFKILYPILFSVSPLVVYTIAKKYLAGGYAFLASVFFMSHNTFLMTTFNPRTTVAILFVALSIMVLISDRHLLFEKKLFSIIFVFSCIVSHYSTTYIFFGILLFVFISTQVVHRLLTYQEGSAVQRNSLAHEQNIIDADSQASSPEVSKSYITLRVITLFFVMIFLWYSQVTGAAFDSGVGFFVNSMRSLQDFFILESRQESVVLALGFGAEKLEVPRKIAFIFNWLSIFLIAIGVLTTISRYRQRIFLPLENIYNESCLLRKRIDITFLVLALICSVIMAVAVAVPFVSKGYGIDRAYLLTTIVLSSFFVLGGMTIAELFRVCRNYLVVLVVLVPFFMCTTGTMYQVFGYPGSMVLNSEGDSYDVYYIFDQETVSSKWIKNYSQDNIMIYGDFYGGTRLRSQGRLGLNRFMYARDMIENHKPLGKGYFYLRYSNVVKSKFLDSSYHWHNTSDFEDEFMKREKIYSNAGSDIWMT